MATIEIEDMITVGTLAERLMIPVTQLITELMKNGIMATVNERIDFDTAQIIVTEMGLDTELVRETVEDAKPREKRVTGKTAVTRPPVVAVMGHVDHGKTSLLDVIQGSSVAPHEAGGITQHIAAYQVEHDGRYITLLDTPGHEAFAALREHGAQLTDLIILVVAADDGVKPQTIETIRFARNAGVKVLIAVNKIDKPGADPNKVKQQLAEQDVLVEEWGGDTVVMNVSAKTGEGIKELLDMAFLITDVEELKAEQNAPAEGLIIESHMEKGRGPSAVVLVETGTLKPGDFVVAGSTYAHIRTLQTTRGETINQALPSTPALITGFKALPEFGDTFSVVNNEKEARNLAAEKVTKHRQDRAGRTGTDSTELIRLINRTNELTELNVVVKADVQGSLTSVLDSLKSLDTKEVAVRIVGSGVGTIKGNDLHLARSSHAIIYGFNVTIPTNIRQLASRDKIPVRIYKVIYELIDNAKEELSSLLAPEVVETPIGRLVVKGVFKVSKNEVICGGEVTKGKVVVAALARVKRGDEELAEVEITNLKRGPQDAKEVFEGDMCGMSLKTTTKVDVQIDDHIELFSRESIERSL